MELGVEENMFNTVKLEKFDSDDKNYAAEAFNKVTLTDDFSTLLLMQALSLEQTLY